MQPTAHLFISCNDLFNLKNLDADLIISHLEKVQGSAEKKEEFTRLIIDEATRFKKNKLVERLNSWLTTHAQTVQGQNSRNHVKKTVNR